jgi:hypothetical protein
MRARGQLCGSRLSDSARHDSLPHAPDHQTHNAPDALTKGGYGGKEGEYRFVDSLVALDTVTGDLTELTPAGVPPTARAYHSWAAVGHVCYVFGGRNGRGILREDDPTILCAYDTLQVPPPAVGLWRGWGEGAQACIGGTGVWRLVFVRSLLHVMQADPPWLPDRLPPCRGTRLPAPRLAHLSAVTCAPARLHDPPPPFRMCGGRSAAAAARAARRRGPAVATARSRSVAAL